MTATQAGNSVFAPAQLVRTFSVAAAGTSTTVSVAAKSPNPAPQFSDTVTVAGTVTPAATATGDGVFSGTLSFQLNGKPTPPRRCRSATARRQERSTSGSTTPSSRRVPAATR